MSSAVVNAKMLLLVLQSVLHSSCASVKQQITTVLPVTEAKRETCMSASGFVEPL